MLGEAISMLVPQVVGFRLSGRAPGGRDRDRPRPDRDRDPAHDVGVVGKFVEYFGPGLAGLSLADRATIGNMSPEYGATCGFFPVDEETLQYLAPDRPARRADRPRRGVLQGATCSGTTPTSSRRTRRSSSSTSALSSRASPGRADPRTGCRSRARSRPSSTRCPRFGVDYGNGERTRRSPRASRLATRPPTSSPGHGTVPPAARRRGRRPKTARARRDGHRRRRDVRAHPRRRRHRRDHELHEHVESRRHGRRRAAREERGRARPRRASPG